jgi:penicillin V acylase-like amidase (Ntn superfamily)
MIRAVSVPFVPPTEINTGIDVWPTLWRVYYDTKDMVSFYESSVEPIFLWMDFKEFNLSKNVTTQRLALADVAWEYRVGNMNPKQFSDSKPFVPVGWE